MSDKILLHITHTDVRSDARILKELEALTDIPKCKIYAIGVDSDPGSSIRVNATAVEIITIGLITRRLQHLPRIIRYFFNFLELLIRMVWQSVTLKPDVIHCHDTLVLPIGSIIRIFTGSKLVYDAHELESQKTGQTRILSKITLMIEKMCWKWVDVFISVSDSIIDWYRSNLGPKHSVLILNTPTISKPEIVTTTNNNDKKYFRDTYGIPKDEKIFLYLGMLSEGRGIRACLASFADSQITDHVVFMGTGILADLIDEYSREHDNIHRHNPVPHAEVVTVASNADCGLCFIENVSLSYYYCLPNKLFEYAFAGLPVLASNFPEIRKIVDGYSLGVCCAPEVEDIKQAISAVGQVTGRSGSGDLAELAWPVQAQRLVRAYNTLLQN